MNPWKQARTTALILLAGIPTQVMAAEQNNSATLSANLAATSTYVWRGLAQTLDAALQGGLDYTTAEGPHASLWTSTVSGGSELDVTLGFAGVATKGIHYDVGLILYMYPQYEAAASPGQDYNFNEIYAEISKDMLSARFSTSPDTGNYLEVNANFANFAASWDLGVHFGAYDVDTGYTALPGEDYNDYNVSLGNTVDGFDLTFTLSDTDLADDSYRTIITLGKSFKP